MNLLAYLKAFAYSAAVFLPLTIGAYFYGRSDGRAALVAEQAEAVEKIRQQDSAVRRDVEEYNRAAAESAVQTEVENDAIQESLDASEPSDSNDFASDGWVRNLQRFK